MARTLEDKIAALPAARRKAIAARTAELVAEEMTLRDMRKALGRTQVAVAKKLRVGQDAISRVEKRTDMLMSTLNDYVESLGGRLVMTAEFKGRRPVRIKALGDLSPVPKRLSARAGRKTAR